MKASLLLLSLVLSTPAFADDLTILSAVDHWRNGGGQPVQVDASNLTIHQSRPWNADGWSPGVVQGADFFVHGRVGLIKTESGVQVKPELYDFDTRTDGSFLRNVNTLASSVIAGRGDAYEVVFVNSPIVVTDGYSYGQ